LRTASALLGDERAEELHGALIERAEQVQRVDRAATV